MRTWKKWQQELKDAKAEKRRIRRKLKILLLQRIQTMIRTSSLKSVEQLVEMKQHLFAGDLLTMYQKYAEAQGWRFEVMEAYEWCGWFQRSGCYGIGSISLL